jgi:hypothetical protein
MEYHFRHRECAHHKVEKTIDARSAQLQATKIPRVRAITTSDTALRIENEHITAGTKAFSRGGFAPLADFGGEPTEPKRSVIPPAKARPLSSDSAPEQGFHVGAA